MTVMKSEKCRQIGKDFTEQDTFCFLISHLVSSERDIFLVRSTYIVFIIKVSPFAGF